MSKTRIQTKMHISLSFCVLFVHSATMVLSFILLLCIPSLWSSSQTGHVIVQAVEHRWSWTDYSSSSLHPSRWLSKETWVRCGFGQASSDSVIQTFDVGLSHSVWLKLYKAENHFNSKINTCALRSGPDTHRLAKLGRRRANNYSEAQNPPELLFPFIDIWS